MFLGGFKEATENMAEFTEDSPEAFEILQGWVYRDILPKPNMRKVNDNTYTAAWKVIELYVLTDKLCLFLFKGRDSRLIY